MDAVSIKTTTIRYNKKPEAAVQYEIVLLAGSVYVENNKLHGSARWHVVKATGAAREKVKNNLSDYVCRCGFTDEPTNAAGKSGTIEWTDNSLIEGKEWGMAGIGFPDRFTIVFGELKGSVFTQLARADVYVNKEKVNIRENLLYCSLFNEQRMSWWQASRTWNKESSYIGNDKPVGGAYAMDGYNLFQLYAKPGQMEDLRQQLYTFDSGGRRQSKLKSNTWYTLSFKVRGVLRNTHDDGTYTDFDGCPVVLYVTNNVSGISTGVIDTSAGVIIDGTPTKPYPYGDMSVLIKCGWAITTHTITFKTRALVSNSESAHAPTLYIRSFGKGYSGLFAEEFVNGGAYFRVAAIKLEEGQEATAFTPHVTETLSPIYSTAFIRSVETPSAPSGGSYSSPNPTTRGWSDGIPPTGDGRLWASSAIFYPEVSGATWSAPAPMTDTSISDVEFCPYDGIPNVPSETVGKADWDRAPAKTRPNATTKLWFDINRNSDVTKEEQAAMKWRAECQIENGKRGTWWISKAKGEDGTSFTPKGSAEAHFDSETAFASATRVAGKYYLVDSTPNAKLYLWNGSNAVAQTVEDNWAYTTADFTLWVKSGPKWVSFGKIQGPQGPQGPQGDSAWSYAVVADINAIPVNSQGFPLITSFQISKNITHGSEKVNGLKTYKLSYKIYVNTDSGEEESGNGITDADSLTVSLTGVSSLVITRVVCELLESPGKQVHSITLYPLKNGSNGEDSIRLDLSNEMDAVAADENGNITPRTCSTVVSLFKGAERVTLTEDKVSATNSINSTNNPSRYNSVHITANNTDGTVTVSYDVYNLGYYDEALTETITVRYNGIDYKADFTIVAQKQGVTGSTGAPGNDAVLYQLNPSDTALVFARGSSGNFTEESKTITCGLLSIVGNETKIVTKDIETYAGLYLYYRLDGWNYYYKVNFNANITVSNTANSVKLVLSKYNYNESTLSIDKTDILDTETIPVVKEGRKGDAGDSTIVEGARGVGVFRRFMNGEQLYYKRGEAYWKEKKRLTFDNISPVNKAVLVEGLIKPSSSSSQVQVVGYCGRYIHIMFGNTINPNMGKVTDMSDLAFDNNKAKSYLVWRISSSANVEYDPSKYNYRYINSIGGSFYYYVGTKLYYVHIRFGTSVNSLSTAIADTVDSNTDYKIYVRPSDSMTAPTDWSESDGYVINKQASSSPIAVMCELQEVKEINSSFAPTTANNEPINGLVIELPSNKNLNRIDVYTPSACYLTDLRVSLLDLGSFNEVDGQYLGVYSSNVETAPGATDWNLYSWCRFRDPNNIQRVPVPAGNYASNVVYEATDVVSPMVKYGDYYYMMCRSGITQGLDPAKDAALDNPTTWMKVEKYNAVYTEILMASLGLIGKAVFNGDFMYSQQGYTIDSNGNKVAANYGDFGMPSFDKNEDFHPNVLIDFVKGILRCRKAVVEESTFDNCTVNDTCKITKVEAIKGTIGGIDILEDRLSSMKEGAALSLGTNGMSVAKDGYSAGLNVLEGLDISGNTVKRPQLFVNYPKNGLVYTAFLATGDRVLIPTGNLIIENLPDRYSPDLKIGQLYRDGDNVKIVIKK